MVVGTVEQPPSSGLPAPGHNVKRRMSWVPIVLQLAAMIGIGALLYPYAADWFARIGHSSEISGYIQTVNSLPDDVSTEKLQAAQQYNSEMPLGELQDPFTSTAGSSSHRDSAEYQDYLDALQIDGTAVIGELSYPELNIFLPIYAGTDDEVLRRGVGHLYGSSLPIGGSSTHSVLTSHSGLINARLFTDLPDAEVGDTFSLTVMGEKRYYTVQQLETVLPEQTESLRILDGRDRVTLITCTPIGINSHRLLVHAERTEAPSSAEGHTTTEDGMSAGFPWWAVIFLGGSAAVAYLLFKPNRTTDTRLKKHRKQEKRA